MIRCANYIDGPAGGCATGPGLAIVWQDGPRGKNDDGTLGPATGAFVEDALVAAKQRLEFFQFTQYAHDDNAAAINYISLAIEALARRAKERAERGVLGQNIV